MMPRANIGPILEQASALALQTVRDEARRLLPESAGKLVSLSPLARAIGVSEAALQRVISSQVDTRNFDNRLALLKSSRQAVLETFNAVKFVATIDSDLPLPDAFVYCTQEDERVRKTHMELEDATLPPTDPFWRTYWPPNDHGCRCFVRSIYGAFSPYKPKTKYKPSSDFSRNLGQDFLINLLKSNN